MTHEIEKISNKIWQAKQNNDMKDVEHLIADNAKFVHMGITFDKKGEVNAFNEKIFIYKNIEVSEEKIEDFGTTAIIYKKLILTAEVGGANAQNPFIVTEIFSKDGEGWVLVSETYTRIGIEFKDYIVL